MIKVLIAVESCQRDKSRGFHDAIRNTWFKDLRFTDKRFFMGLDPTQSYDIDKKEDEIILDVSDGYKALPLKTQAMCRWALINEFDFMFKCDTDTVLNPWNLAISGFQNHDYMGGENADVNVPGVTPGRIEFVSGGAGYWVSKKVLTIIADVDNIKTQAEDVFVADELLKHGIKPVFHPGYRWRPGSTIDKDTVTLHLSSALQKKYNVSQMYEAYQQIKGVI